MAEMIAQMWSLGVLRVVLDESTTEPTVTCEVVINEGSAREAKVTHTAALADFGFFDARAEGYRIRDLELKVPEELTAKVANWVTGGADDRAVLWLHLVKPYGLLGAVPWENMRSEIGIPVMRLPDVLPRQAPPAGRLDIAVCASAFQTKGDLPLADAAADVLEVAAALNRPATVHYFVDANARDDLHNRLSASADGPMWQIHSWDDFDWQARSTDRSRGGRRYRSDNPWLSWMQTAVHKQAFDVVHFICHGYLTGYADEGVLSLAATPDEHDASRFVHVTSPEILNFADRVGAFVVGFTSLQGNYSTSALRLVADAVGSRRAGPVFLYDEELGGVDDLAYAYLMTMGEIPDQYPMSSSLITYVQPELVMVDQDRAASTDGYGYVVTSEVATEVAASFPSATGAITPEMAEETPPWVSVLARYVDEKRGDLTNLIRADYELGADPDEQAYVKGVEKALRHLDGVVSKYSGGSS